MGEVLTQAEIEALLAGVPASSAATQVARKPDEPAAGRRRQTVREYNFRSPNKFSRDQLRALQMVHETFGRQLSTAFAASLRSPVHFDIVSTQQLPYQEFMDLLTSSIIYIFSAPPLEGPMLLEIHSGLGLYILERLLGGFGSMTATVDRALTEIERTILHSVAERMLDALASAWSAMVDLRPRIEGTETDPQFVQIVQPTETIVAVLFEVKIGEETGTMNLCMPCVVLEPIASKLSAQQWLTSTRKPATEQTIAALQARLAQTTAEASVVLGEARLSMRELVHLKPGDVIVLDRNTNDPLVMRIAGRPKFHVRPGLVGKRMAVRVESLLRSTAPDEEEGNP